MRSLIYKDLLLQKKMLLFAIGYGIFLFIAFNNPIFKDFVYNMGTIAVSYIMLMQAVSFDEKNNTDIIFVSMPIDRKKIILEKYLLVFVTVLIGLSVMGILGAVIRVSALIEVTRFVNINDFLFSLTSVLLLSSVYFPLYLKLGNKYSRIINMIFFLFLFFMPSWLTGYLMNNVDKRDPLLQQIIETVIAIPTWVIGSTLLAITLVFALFSYIISVRIYMNKEF